MHKHKLEQRFWKLHDKASKVSGFSFDLSDGNDRFMLYSYLPTKEAQELIDLYFCFFCKSGV